MMELSGATTTILKDGAKENRLPVDAGMRQLNEIQHNRTYGRS
jgi:hypothetical protein